MPPRLRGKADAPLQYGPADRDSFTIELHHGGFFVGFGNLRSYVDEKVHWFDWIESDIWSAVWFKDFLQELGYQSVANIKFHWLLPGMNFPEGLRLIKSDSDALAMISVVHKVKNLVVYADESDSINNEDWDDIVGNPANELPKVLSPHKVVYVDKNPREKLPVFYTDLKKGRVDQVGSSKASYDAGGDEQQDFCDTDYEISDGDEDLLEDAVEINLPQVKGKNKKAKDSQLKAIEISVPTPIYDDVDTEDENLDLPKSDGEGEGRLRFNSWSEEDMNNPAFSVGLVFPSVQSVREAITEYSLRNRVEIKLPRNDKKRIRAHCADGCPWNMYVSWDSRVKSRAR
ncbi:uncharacterized protein LOC8080815 [Sorghum bicolor]|uniref:uncharacterized protein LOC8080815 n=1 Tax=Sorghum bicolor TaxID=4558 RepID=UPI00081AD011|nr:uncharacterized protein LOC8080815 [Sorghum bicolor]|eukprot:XP_002467844.2 uncharacterized protein LOC8080815 [Sorghum bicolor]